MAKEVAAAPARTPLSLKGTGYGTYNIKLWDERPTRYAKNVFKHVCVPLLMLTTCNQIANFAIGQSLKNFFQKLGWSNNGSNAIRFTYGSLTQFSCVIAGYIADERIGKFNTLLSAASLELVGLLLVVIAAAPSVLANRTVSKVLFNIGLFGGVALSQICLRALVVSYGGDQFSPLDTSGEKSVFFGYQYWSANIAALVGFALFPSLSANGFGAIPAEYGYFATYTIALAAIVLFVVMLYSTRRRYVNVPPRRSSVTVVISLIATHAKTNFRARMIVLGTVLYIAAFLLNILAAFLTDAGSAGENIAYVCGVLIVLATALWVYFGRDPSFLESAKDTAGGVFDGEIVDGVKKVVRILPFNAFNVVFWMCQSQSGNNQSMIQQTDVRVGASVGAYQIPGPTVQMFNPVAVLAMIPLAQNVIYPLYEKRAGKKPSAFGKVLTGYSITAVAVVWMGVFEVVRRSAPPLTFVDTDGKIEYILNNDGGQVMNDIRWYTAIPQYLLIATGEIFAAVTSYDINYSEVPASMRGTSVALGFFVNSMGSTLMSVIVQLFGKYIPADLNDGHMEFMYFTSGAIMLVNIAVYVAVMSQMRLGMLPPVVDNDGHSSSAAKVEVVKIAVAA